jgi:hypothetical protein
MKLIPQIGRYLAFLTKWFGCGMIGLIVYEAIALQWLRFAPEYLAQFSGVTMGWAVFTELLNGPMWKGTKLREEE